MIDLFGNSGETHGTQGQFTRDPVTGALVPMVVEQTSRGERSFDIFSRSFAFTSYRDPNLLGTIDNYDGAASFLRKPVSQQDLTRSIIGVIGTVDAYRLPDAKGFVSMVWELIGDTEAARQARREQILSATQKDFEALADALDQVARYGRVVVLGSETAIKAANDERGAFLEVTRVL